MRQSLSDIIKINKITGLQGLMIYLKEFYRFWSSNRFINLDLPRKIGKTIINKHMILFLLTLRPSIMWNKQEIK
jgi:hypothetical protein